MSDLMIMFQLQRLYNNDQGGHMIMHSQYNLKEGNWELFQAMIPPLTPTGTIENHENPVRKAK